MKWFYYHKDWDIFKWRLDVVFGYVCVNKYKMLLAKGGG